MESAINRLGSELFDTGDLLRIFEEYELPCEEFCNRCSITVAERFLKKEIKFLEADTVANNLFALMIEKCGSSLPEPAYSIYLAFDAGEWHHPSDKKEDDPEDLYTIPDLAKILKNQKSNKACEEISSSSATRNSST